MAWSRRGSMRSGQAGLGPTPSKGRRTRSCAVAPIKRAWISKRADKTYITAHRRLLRLLISDEWVIALQGGGPNWTAIKHSKPWPLKFAPPTTGLGQPSANKNDSLRCNKFDECKMPVMTNLRYIWSVVLLWWMPQTNKLRKCHISRVIGSTNFDTPRCKSHKVYFSARCVRRIQVSW